MGGDYADRWVADGCAEELCGPSRRAAAFANRKERADEGAHHVVAERIGDYASHGHSVRAALPRQLPQCPDGGSSLPPAAERGEVMLPEQQGGGLVHCGEVQRALIPERVIAPQRVRGCWVVRDPVRVPPPQRGEPRIKALRCRSDPPNPKIRRQRPGKPPQNRIRVRLPSSSRHIRVRHLPVGMHPRVSPPSHSQASRLR